VSTERERSIEAQLEVLISLMRELVALMHEVLDRPRPTVIHLSAWSVVQIERFTRVLIEQVRKVWKEKP
jgi:hypothetical protein